jgi:hypothetical protein
MNPLGKLILRSLPFLVALPLSTFSAWSRDAAPRPAPTQTGIAAQPQVTDSFDLEGSLLQAAPTLRPDALRAALHSRDALMAGGEVTRPILTVIDYSLPSTVRRMWVFDLESHRLLVHELVAHGRNSGEDLARKFSNEEGSLMTSLGAFVTESTYIGHNGLSLRLRGMEPGINDRAEARTIVMHGAPYVNEQIASKLGRLGRSHGCPALRPAVARAVINLIKDHTLLYAWYPSNG